MKKIEGGVCAAKGFRAAGVHCGVKANSPADKNDLALIVSDTVAATAATFTSNRVKAAPIYVCMEHLENGLAQAIVANSGNANACAPEGMENAKRMAAAAAKAAGVDEDKVLVGSTGVIGQRLNVETIEAHMDEVASKLEASAAASQAANNAIMTTDTVEKTAAVAFTCGGKTCHIGGIAKGSGMIHPNMGTMLCFITTDCAIDPSLLRSALREVVSKTFNRISVDGDTSTNDTCIVMANGMAGNELLDWKSEEYHAFYNALYEVALTLAKKMAADGEGATKLVTVTVSGAASEQDADRAARTVANSPLVKTAVAGHDCNWGRIAAALGRSGASFRQEDVDIDIMGMPVMRSGLPCGFDEDEALRRFEEPEISIDVALGAGEHSTRMWTCDFTHDYITINGDYRT